MVLCVFYSASALSNLFLTAEIVSRLGTRLAFSLSFFLYILFIASHIRLVSWVIFLASALSGIGSGILWTAHGVYMSEISTTESIGYLTGLFYSIYQLNQVFGNLVAATLFALSVNVQVFYLVFSLIALSSLICVVFLVKYKPTTTRSSFTLIEPEKPRDRPDMPSCLLTLRLFSERSFLFTIPLFLAMGMHTAFCFSTWTQSIPSRSLLGWVLFTFGMTNVLASYSSGKLAQSLASPRQQSFLLFIALVAVLSGLSIFSFFPHIEYWTFFLTSIFFAISDAAAKVYSYTLIRILAPSHQENAFAFSSSLQACATAIGFFLSTILGNSYMALLLASSYSMGFIGVLTLLHYCMAPVFRTDGEGCADYGQC